VLDLSYVLGVALGDAIYERTGHMPAWRTCADVRVVAVTNWTRVQAALFPGARLVEHNGLRFRSHTETRLAQALDEMGVMYFPLPVAVRGKARREPDFVIVHRGMAGVLEVDGPHHTNLTRAHEDQRAEWFLQSGFRLVRHYSVQEIDTDAKGVVRRFLQLMRGPVV
jgi:hypothetical protein